MANRYRVYERSVFWFIPVLFVVFLVLLVPWVAHAEGSSWVEGSPKLYEDSTAPPSTYQKIRQCDTSTVTVHVSVLVAKQQQMCLIHSLYFTIAQVDQTTYDGYQSYISFSGDTDFYPVSTSRGRVFYPLENADTVVISGFTTENAGLLVYQDAAHRFTQQDDGSYQFNMSNPTYPSDNTALLVNGWSVSDDGDSLVYGYGSTSGPGNDRYVVLNLKDFSRKTIGVGHWKWFYSPIAPVPVISPSGRYVMLGGSRDIKVWDTSGCGASGLDDLYQKPDPCPSAHIVIDKPCAGYCGTNGFIFNDDYDVEFTFNNGSGTMSRLGYRAAGYVQPTSEPDIGPDAPPQSIKLRYLALGDSYSSGEGDLPPPSGMTHYLPGTSGNSQCHISYRSYPFLLRDHYKLEPRDMKSIACSGAQVVLDYIGNDDSYMGQNSQLKKLQEPDRVTERENALINFTPGVVKQLDFVKKYQPDVVTFTGGGNDIGFANILEYCAKPYVVAYTIPIPFTCDYAKPDSGLNHILYNAIDYQYGYNRLLIEGIKQLSPSTRIILVGYPSFVSPISNSPTQSCLGEAGSLNSAERSMINDAVKYTNSMLQALSHDTDVSYVNIEDTLNGGRICDVGHHYVNGIINSAVGSFGLDGSFHPNARGHQKIADAIVNSGVFTKPKTPEGSEYKKKSKVKHTEPASFIDKAKVIIGVPLRIIASASMFQPNTLINSELHSDIINLGTFMAQPDGSLSVSVPSNNLPAGTHVLVINGIDSGGQPVTYYQFIDIVEPHHAVNNPEYIRNTEINTPNNKHPESWDVGNTDVTPKLLADKHGGSIPLEGGGGSGADLSIPPIAHDKKRLPLSNNYDYIAILIITIGSGIYYASYKKTH